MISTSFLSDLNPQQRSAATYGKGPLLVVAGAGSGKTRTLAYRVAWLISQGIPPGRILLLTFTRRAAEEMLRRAAGVFGNNSSIISEVWSGTFHAIANRLLRIYAQAAGLSPTFTILDQSDAEDLLDVIRHEKLLDKKLEKRFPRKSTCLEIYSKRVNSNDDLETVLKRHFPWCLQWKNELAQIYLEYSGRKQQHNALDYDDLLLYWYYLLKNQRIAESIESRFDYILVDEYQDTNVLQSEILRLIRQKNHNIMAVGDDAQSIYGFRCATVRNMLDFPSHFPNATIITLEQNYRSTEPILLTTNTLIAQARHRYSKQLWSSRTANTKPRLITCADESCQDRTVVTKILEHYEQGISLRKQAVLFRASYHSASLELELSRRNIPFRKYGGIRFLEAAHIKDLICILRIVENPHDQPAWFRILQLLDGVGPATAAKVVEHVRSANFDVASIATFPASRETKEDFRQLSLLFEDIATLSNKEPAIQIDRIALFYIPILKRNYDNAEVRVADIKHLVQLASGYRSREKFLSDLVLDPPASTSDLARNPSLDEDWLVLSTIHSAKGCEWDVVYLIHTADGCLPSDMATSDDEEIEEELRLTYVAMTRARDYLYVLWPMRYYAAHRGHTDVHTYAQLSRFFNAEVLATMEQEIGGDVERNYSEYSRAELGSDLSIVEQMRKIWE